MELDSVGSLGFDVNGKRLELEVFKCEVPCEAGDRFYYVVRIQRECFERVLAALGDNPLVDSRKFEDRDDFFPNNENSFAFESTVIIRGVEESGDDRIFYNEIVNLGQKAYWKTRIRGVVKEVATLVKEVFDANIVDEVLVMVDANGEDPVSAAEKKAAAAAAKKVLKQA